MIEFVDVPSTGRRFELESRVRLSDITTSGELRLDGVARTLQDIATDDWDASGIDTSVAWVARRTAFRWTGDYWPRYQDRVRALTWCAGAGPAWAERRTNLYVGETLCFEAASLWVPISAEGAPVRIPADFYDVYGEAMGGRKVSARVRQTAPSADFVGQPFVIRRADLDIMGHVNNAAVWQVVAEYVAPPVRYGELVHHGPVEMDHDVTVVVEEDQVWLLVDGDVRVSGSVVR
jgi:acyl-ACP thioesterase